MWSGPSGLPFPMLELKENAMDIPFPIPFVMLSEHRVQISLDAFWEYARFWAHTHGYQRIEGAYRGLPPI